MLASLSSKSALLLLVCTAFAALDYHLAGALASARAVNEREPAGTLTAHDASGATAALLVDRPAPAHGVPSTAALSQVLQEQAARSSRERLRARDVEFLRMHADRYQRRQLIEEGAMDRRNALRGVDRALDIEPDRWQRLSRTLAETDVEILARRLRCQADPRCTVPDVDAAFVAERERAVRDVLGEVKAREFAAYAESLRERRQVETLQARLGGTPLAAEHAESLIQALAEERGRAQRDWKPQSVTTRGFGTPELGMLYYPDSATTSVQRIAAATSYSARMRERASTQLTGDALVEFNHLQDELLARFAHNAAGQ